MKKHLALDIGVLDELTRTERMLTSIPAHDRDTWVRVAMAMKARFGGDALETWLNWSATADNFNQRDALTVWRSIDPGGPIGFGTLIHVAREHGWSGRLSLERQSGRPSRRVSPASAPKPWMACLPVPVRHAERFRCLRHPEYGEPARWWCYESTDHELMYVVARFEGPTGKQIRPASFGTDGSGAPGWRWKRPHVLIPWSLPELYARPDAPVVICEGEKAAEAARALLSDYVVTCGHGGAHQARKTHWGHLARRDCLIFPDDDAASVEVWAPCLARILLELGASVRVVDPSRLWGAVA